MRTSKALMIVAVISLSLVLSSCQTKEESVINKMEQLAERIDKDGQSFDQNDWQAVFKEYEKLQEEALKCDFNQEQIKELGRIEGKLTASFAVEYGKNAVESINGLLESGKNFMDGFMDGLSGEGD